MRFSVHTNGVLALRKNDAFNAHDRACISFPSFEPRTYRAMMGSSKVPDLAEIVRRARIPVSRAVVRRLFGAGRRWPVLEDRAPVGVFRGNPVYDVSGMEVTVWSFDDANLRSLNLFADGTLGTSYLLAETPELGLESG